MFTILVKIRIYIFYKMIVYSLLIWDKSNFFFENDFLIAFHCNTNFKSRMISQLHLPGDRAEYRGTSSEIKALFVYYPFSFYICMNTPLSAPPFFRHFFTWIMRKVGIRNNSGSSYWCVVEVTDFGLFIKYGNMQTLCIYQV